MDVEFDFPLPRVHTGAHLANERMGALVWGSARDGDHEVMQLDANIGLITALYGAYPVPGA